MLSTCKCLNVSVDAKKLELKRLPLTSLKLSPALESHPFFTEGVAEVNEHVVITKEMVALTVAEKIGNWIVETCVNCATPFYAQSQDAQLPNLISANLISDPNTIHSLRKHANYSPVFRIVIKPEVDHAVKKLGKESVQSALSELQHHLGHVIKKQAEKTDENIRIYTDQQYDKLAAFQNRAVHDHEALIRLLKKAEAKELANDAAVNPLSPTKMTQLLKYDDFGVNSPKFKSHATSAAIGIAPRRSVVARSHSLFDSFEAPASFDAEGVFNLDEIDDSPNEQAVSEGESDTDHDDSGSHDEGIDIHRKKNEPLNMARSLPVNVPAFPSGHFDLQTVEFDSDALDQEPTPRDIAASIKALAQSQHGESVFGDLPRPRFSTRI